MMKPFHCIAPLRAHKDLDDRQHLLASCASGPYTLAAWFKLDKNSESRLNQFGTFSAKEGKGALKHDLPLEGQPWFIPSDPAHGYEYYQRLRAFADNQWAYVGLLVTCTASFRMAEAAVWGIESDLPEDYILGLLNDLAHDAREDFKAMWGEVV